MRRSSNSNASAIPTKCNALLNLVAGLLGVGFDDFKQRDFARSQKRLAILSSFSSPVVVVMAGLTFWALNRQQEAERQQAVQAQKFAETEKAVRENYFTTIALAQTKINESQYAQARELLWSAPQKNGHWEWDRLMRLCQSAMITLQGHKGAVDSSTFYLERKALGYCKS
jgi:hypothetical protein